MPRFRFAPRCPHLTAAPGREAASSAANHRVRCCWPQPGKIRAGNLTVSQCLTVDPILLAPVLLRNCLKENPQRTNTGPDGPFIEQIAPPEAGPSARVSRHALWLHDFRKG